MKENTYVFDIEGDGLNPSKIHCMSVGYFKNGKFSVMSTTDYNKMKSFLKKAKTLIGHNIIRWDIPVLERILDIKIEADLVDTLPLSWYLYSDRNTHGLEDWGEFFNVPKPKIDDWENLSIEEYIHRCEEDVKINYNLWLKQGKDLMTLYENTESVKDFVKYISFKLKCAHLQEKSRWKLDINRCTIGLEKLQKLKETKIRLLSEVMPKIPVKSKRTYPARPYKKDGTLSASGERWQKYLVELGLPEDHKEDITFISSYKEPNPNSNLQIKDWLFSLGWEPEHYKTSVTKEGEREVPQLKESFGDDLCPSVLKLQSKVPEIEHLEGIFIIGHKIGLLKGFLRDVSEEGYLKAEISNITNTLRFRHKTIVNLPAAKNLFSEDIRGSLIAPEGYELCGSDMSSLEDRTKQHYMWPHDPDYVKEMQVEGFDPHLSLAVFAGALTEEQAQNHKNKIEDHGVIRHIYKTANYSCVYGAGGPKVAKSTGLSIKEGREIVSSYRKKNWAVDQIAKETKTKKCLGKDWLYNPVSKFWYELRSEKDKFSTLNQGTGVYCFDLWVAEVLKRRPQLTGQFHDEIILTVKKGYRKEVEKILRDSINRVNEVLKLNRELDIDVQFGDNYAQIH